MLTEKDYCDYDTCVALEELGFIGQGRCYYDPDKEPNKLRRFGIPVLTTRRAKALNFVLAIHLYEAKKWLREEKNLHIEVRWYSKLCYEYEVKEATGETLAVVTAYKTYEEALSEGIKEAVKILKEK